MNADDAKCHPDVEEGSRSQSVLDNRKSGVPRKARWKARLKAHGKAPFNASQEAHPRAYCSAPAGACHTASHTARARAQDTASRTAGDWVLPRTRDKGLRKVPLWAPLTASSRANSMAPSQAAPYRGCRVAADAPKHLNRSQITQKTGLAACDLCRSQERLVSSGASRYAQTRRR
jgi:hypothetical protein